MPDSLNTVIAIPTLDPQQEFELRRILKREKDMIYAQQQEARSQWCDQRAGEYLQRHPEASEKNIKKLFHMAVDSFSLDPLFEIHLSDGTTISVQEILDDPHKYHGCRCCDPLEPDYGDDTRIGYINTKAYESYVYSHAHGGQRYILRREKHKIRLIPGQLDRATDDILRTLQKTHLLYSKGGELVTITAQGIKPINVDGLRVLIAQHIETMKYNNKGETFTPVDVPHDVARAVAAIGTHQVLDQLYGLIAYPTLRLDGSLLQEEGYDSVSRLYLKLPDHARHMNVPSQPAIAEVKAALNTLWSPFEEFPFDTALDKSVYVSALLTAAIRRTLPTSPAFAIESSTPGSGKTLLASCLSVIAGEQYANIRTACSNDDEWNKTLIAAAREDRPVLLFDNITAALYSASLNAFLTAPVFGGRILGKSAETFSVTNMLVVFTGNNLILQGDINRRVLRCRIEPRMEHPETRQFEIDPVVYCTEHKAEIINACLTIIRGGLTLQDEAPTTSTGSYSGWDRLVRQTVIWLGSLGFLDLSDPNESFRINAEADDEKSHLFALLSGLHEKFGVDYFTVNQLLNDIDWSYPLQLSPDRALKESILNATYSRRDTVNANKLGWYFRKHIKRRVGGLMLVQGKKRLGVATWAVMEAD